jgi:small subunit ribosomal protein S1
MKETEDFAALLQELERQQGGKTRRPPQTGERVRGTVVAIHDDQVLVDLGGKTEGVMEASALIDADGHLRVAIGDPIEASVSGRDEATGTLRLGSQHSRSLHGLAEIEDAYRNQLPVEGQVTGVTKGGVEVQIAGQRAFCPASQVDIRYLEDLQELVGQRLSFRITKFEGGRHTNLVVSRRALLEAEQQERAVQTRARLEVGAVLPGTVTALKDYGAFVDLGGVEGMVHVSELAFGRTQHPSELLSVGQTVEVSVLRIEASSNPRQPEKIALSIRALTRDPWADAAERFPIGARVKGSVTRLQPFGAFVEIEPGLEGLIHVSELGAGRRVSHPHEVLSIGQEVETAVLGVDPEKRRISLSLDTTKQTEAVESRRIEDYGKPKQGFGTLGDLLSESLKARK